MANSDVKDTAADSVMADVSQIVAADKDQISTEAPASPKPEADAAASTVDKNEQLTQDTDHADATTGMDVDADKAAPEPEAPSAAAQEAAAAPADEVVEAAAGFEPSQHPANQQGSEESVLSQEEGQEAAPLTTDPEKEDEVQAKPEQSNKEQAETLAQADPREAAKEQAEAELADGKVSMADVDVRIDELKDELAASVTKPDPQADVETTANAEAKAEPKPQAETKAETDQQAGKAEPEEQAGKAEPEEQAGKAEPEKQLGKTKPEEQAGKAEPAQKKGSVHKAEPKAEVALKERSPAGPVSSAQGSAERDSRGVKRPAPAIARGAKQARTNQAAGLRLGLPALLVPQALLLFQALLLSQALLVSQAQLVNVRAFSWAARYNTRLLIKLTPKGVVFSFLFNVRAVTVYNSCFLRPLNATSCCQVLILITLFLYLTMSDKHSWHCITLARQSLTRQGPHKCLYTTPTHLSISFVACRPATGYHPPTGYSQAHSHQGEGWGSPSWHAPAPTHDHPGHCPCQGTSCISCC